MPVSQHRRNGKARGRILVNGVPLVSTIKQTAKRQERVAHRAQGSADPTRGLSQYQCDCFTADRRKLKIAPRDFESIIARMRPRAYYQGLRRGPTGDRVDTRDAPEAGRGWFKDAKWKSSEAAQADSPSPASQSV